jgi:hypothetical protein
MKTKSRILVTGIALTLAVAFVYVGCKKEEEKTNTTTTTTPTCADGIQNQGETGVDCGGPCTACATAHFFKITSQGGVYDSPSTSGGMLTMVTNQLQFAFSGSIGSTYYGGGNIYFPLGSTSGTYTVMVAGNNGAGLTAGHVALDMSSNYVNIGAKNIAQSGTVALTVSGTSYTIIFTDLPSLDDTPSHTADLLSADLAY